MKYALINGKILDGTKNMQVKDGLIILIDDKKISAIVSSDGADLRDYKVINLRGHYVMPGLINMHVHLAGNGKPQKKIQIMRSRPIGKL